MHRLSLLTIPAIVFLTLLNSAGCTRHTRDAKPQGPGSTVVSPDHHAPPRSHE
jgi:hypothetical protein